MPNSEELREALAKVEAFLQHAEVAAALGSLIFCSGKTLRPADLRAALSQSAGGDGWRLVPVDPTEAMIEAAEAAVGQWRKTLSRDEAIARSYQAHDRKFVASATPAEKHAIRYRAMISAAPTPQVKP